MTGGQLLIHGEAHFSTARPGDDTRTLMAKFIEEFYDRLRSDEIFEKIVKERVSRRG